MDAVEFKNVDIVFGNSPERALTLLDQGKEREEIFKATDNTVGVHNATLAVKQGEISVLMGLSGSGKSTLLRCVNGLNRPTRGQVLVRDGDAVIDVASCDKAVLHHLRANRISMVFQQFALLPWRTVAENVGLGLELKGVPPLEREAVVDEKLKLVHLQEWKHKFAHELSGGMQQRVGLARAFATDADILLMDEPFSALDPLIRNHLQDELLELQISLQKTILFVSHDLEEAVKIGTHIGIMKSGKVVQYGTPENIIFAPVNDYVAAFVAHLNPLHLLKAYSLMTRLEDLPKDGEAYLLDRRGHYRLQMDLNTPYVVCDGTPLPLWFLKEHPPPEDSKGFMQVAPAQLTMQTLVESLWQSGHPVLVEADEKIIGIVRGEEIYQNLLPSRNALPHGARKM